MPKPTVTQAEVREHLSYNPETGQFTRLRILHPGRWKIGSIAGAKPDKQGRIRVDFKGWPFFAHQLAFLYMDGRIPKEIDHINGNAADNRWCNLRETTHRENMMNCQMRSHNTSGVMGVWRDKARNLWAAEIKHFGEKIHLGRFSNLEDAANARRDAEEQMGYHANHGRPRNVAQSK